MLSPKIRQARRGKSNFLGFFWAPHMPLGKCARTLGQLSRRVSHGAGVLGPLPLNSEHPPKEVPFLLKLLGCVGNRPEVAKGRWPA